MRPSLNLILLNLPGKMKLPLEKKITGGLLITIFLIASFIIVSFLQDYNTIRQDRPLFYMLAGATMLILCGLYSILKIDIRKRKAEEYKINSNKKLLDQFLQSSNDLIQHVARDGSFLNVNQSWLKTLGYNDEDVKDLNIFEVIAPESLEAFSDIFRRLLMGEPFNDFEVTYLTKEGKKVVLAGNSTCWFQQGKLNCSRFFFKDITDKKIAEENLQKLNEELESRVKEKTVALEKTNEQLQIEITEHKKAELQLRNLSTKLQSVREEERTRIAREIHDELGQQLTGLKMDLSWINKEVTPETSSKIKGMISRVDDTIKTVRKISTELRPGILDDLGLIAAIEWQCSEMKKRNGIDCAFNTELEDIDFGTNISTEVFRIVQETMTNIVRHSGATSVKMEMHLKDDELMLQIDDNGKGITEEEIEHTKSLGILGMNERAKLLNGKFSVTGKLQGGTRVKILIPVTVSVTDN